MFLLIEDCRDSPRFTQGVVPTWERRVYLSANGMNQRVRIEQWSGKMVRRKAARTTDATGGTPTLAEKLDRLFQSTRSPNGSEYTYAEVAAGINAGGIATISDTYLCDLRNGTKENPRIRHVEALAQFFRVPVTYFLDGDGSSQLFDQLETLPVSTNADVRRIALRAVDLSPETLEAVAGIIERARQLEGLKDRPATVRDDKHQ